MGLVHEELYRSKNLSRIDFREYLIRLVGNLLDSYSLNPGQVQKKIEAEQTFFDIETTIPLGLILNELITNSLKYAFPDNKKGELFVYLNKSKDAKYDYSLIIGDTGVGLSQDIDFKNMDSLGIVLVNTLVKQLHGVISCETGNGTTFSIQFNKLAQKKK